MEVKHFFKQSVLSMAVFLFFIGISPASAETEVLRSATEHDYPPFSITSNGKAEGFAPDLLRATLKEVGREVDFYTDSWTKIKKDLEEERIDVLPLVGRTPEREPIFDFTVPYTSVYGNIFVRNDNTDIRSISDLETKEVIVMKDDNAEEYVIRNNVSEKVIETATLEEAFRLLSGGKHDALITLNVIGAQLLKKLDVKNVVSVAQINDYRQDFAFAVKEGDNDLLATLNEGLSKIISNGIFDSLYDKWFEQSDYTKKIVSITSKESANQLIEYATKTQVENITKQLNVFLHSNPSISTENFLANEIVKDIIFQPIKNNGYGALANRKSQKMVLHPNKDVENQDLSNFSKVAPEWWALYQKSLREDNLCGYYKWPEANGGVSQKYLCSKNIKIAGEDYILAVTAYVEEFEEQVNFENKGFQIAENFRALLDETVEDVLLLTKLDLKDHEKAKKEILDFSKSKNREIWFNLGSDLESIEQRKTIPLYKEITVTNKEGEEIIKLRDGQFSEELRDVSDPANTEYKKEEYFTKTKSLPNGKVNIGKVMTQYTPKDEVFQGMEESLFNKYENVIARDTMKQGIIRFSAPIYKNNEFAGIVVLSLDYQHLQALGKHIEPTQDKLIISASYSGNYLLVFDVDGNTIIHPKPNNIRGVLADGSLAGFNQSEPKKEGAIFNLFHYDKSPAYPKMAKKVLHDKAVYNSSATDVSGRTKLTVAVPIEYKNPKTNYESIGIFGGIMMSISLESETEEKVERKFAAESIKQKAQDVAKQIEIYLNAYPEKTVKDLQKDDYFQQIAVQQVGETGYTAVTDYDTLINRFHANPKIADSDLHELADKLKGFWSIMSKTKGGNDAEGVYDWKEADGSVKEKYMYIATINAKTADGVGLNVAATTYLDEYEMDKGINDFALQVAEQVNNYLKNNPNMTIPDLQKNKFFENIAIQKINETGYTAVMDLENGQFYFHPQKRLLNTSVSQFESELPALRNILEKTMGSKCQSSSGQYNWIEADGKITKKIMRTACVETPSADGRRLFVTATDYIDKNEGLKYVQKYEVKPGFSYAKNSINQKAFDIAKQIELFIKANPEKTLDDLKNDQEFQNLAVQQVGETGYTYLVTHESGILNFHPDQKIRDTSYDTFQERFPNIWSIIDESIQSSPCKDSSGFYDWADINGIVREKYTYHHCIDAQTADGFSFFIGASTYLDEYADSQANKSPLFEEVNNFDYQKITTIAFSSLFAVFILIVILYFSKVIKVQGVFFYVLVAFVFISISLIFVLNSFWTVSNLKNIIKNNFIKEHYEVLDIQSQVVQKKIEDISTELSFLTSQSRSKPDCGECLENASSRSDNYVHAFYRIDKNSIIQNMWPIDTSALGADLSEQDHMKKIKKTLLPVISNVFAAVEGFQGVTLHYPVIEESEYDGTFAALINIDHFLNDIKIFEEENDEYEAFLLDKNMFVINSNQKSSVGEKITEIEKYSDQTSLIESIQNSNTINYQSFTANGEEHTSISQPIMIKDNIWYLLLIKSEKEMFSATSQALNKIWLSTLLTILALAMLGYFLGYVLTFSLRKEVEKRTTEVNEKARQIKEQLKREAGVNTMNKKLLAEQKESKKTLESKLKELENFQKIIVNRELRMVELKKRIAELEKEKG